MHQNEQPELTIGHPINNLTAGSVLRFRKPKQNSLIKLFPCCCVLTTINFGALSNGAKMQHIHLIQFNAPVVLSKCCNVLNNAFAAHFHKSTTTVFPLLPKIKFLPMDPIIIDTVGLERPVVNSKVAVSREGGAPAGAASFDTWFISLRALVERTAGAVNSHRCLKAAARTPY